MCVGLFSFSLKSCCVLQLTHYRLGVAVQQDLHIASDTDGLNEVLVNALILSLPLDLNSVSIFGSRLPFDRALLYSCCDFAQSKPGQVRIACLLRMTMNRLMQYGLRRWTSLPFWTTIVCSPCPLCTSAATVDLDALFGILDRARSSS
jgi:hypothetical protein